jgi:hypothetical protein
LRAALGRVAQEIIVHRNFLELLLGLLVAWIEVRVQLLRQPPIGRLNVVLGSGLLAPKTVLEDRPDDPVV